jgi:hypothetical protein
MERTVRRCPNSPFDPWPRRLGTTDDLSHVAALFAAKGLRDVADIQLTHVPVEPRAARSPFRWAIGSFALLVVVGLLNLAQPLHGDQAFFFVIARQIQHGDVLYGDIVDLKQPAIFLLYLLAGNLFGWTAVGAHLLELLWWLAFAVVLSVTVAPRFRHPVVRAVVPGGVGVAYYLGVTSYDLGQVEALVGFPLFVAWWFAREPRPDDHRGQAALALAGFAAAVVILFKYPYVLVAVALWVLALVRARRRGATNQTTARSVGWIAAGFAVPTVVFVIYFGANGQLGNVWDSWVVMSRESRDLWPPTTHDLVHSTTWFLRRYLVLWVLAALPTYQWLRRRTALTGELLLWMVVGGLTVLPQHLWEYLWFVVMVPLALLAALGVDSLLTDHQVFERRRAVAFAGAVALLGLPLWRATLSTVSQYVRNDLALTVDGRRAIADEILPDTITIDEQVSKLRAAGDVSNGIYVFGDPRYHLQTDQPYPARYHGWAFEYYSPQRWHDLVIDLGATRPAYIFIDADWADLVHERSPELTALLEQHYNVWSTETNGTWYHHT